MHYRVKHVKIKIRIKIFETRWIISAFITIIIIAQKIQQRRSYLGAGLSEAEDIINEQQDVLSLLVSEVLSYRQTGQSDAGTGARRFIHLTVDKRHFGLVTLEVNDPGHDHLVVEVVALAGTFTDAGEDGVAAVSLGDVVDQLHDEDSLTDTGSTEQTCVHITVPAH